MNKKLESLNVEETTRDDPESITYTQKELVDLRKKKKDDEAAQKSYLIQLKSFLLDSHQTRRSWEAETTNSARGRGRGVTDSTGALGNSSGAAGAAGSSSGRGRPSSSINGVNRPTPQVVSPAGNVVESDKLPVWRRKERTLSEVSNEATQKCTAAAVVQQQQQPASSSSSGIFSSNRASSIIGGGAPPFTKLERPPDRRSRKAAAVADDNNSWESSSGAENQLMRLLARVQDTVNIKDLSASQLLAQLQSLASSGGSKQQLSSEDSPHENSDVAAVASCSSPSSSQVPMRPSAPSPPQPLASPQQQPSPPPAAVPTAASLVQRPTSPPTQHPPAVPRQHHPGMPQQQQQQPLHTLPHAPNVAPQYSTMPRGHMKESSVGDEGVKTGNSAHIKSPAHLEMLIQYLKQAQLNQPPPPPPPKVLPSVQRFQKLPEIHPTMSYSAASRRQPTTTTTNSGMEDLIDNLIDRVVNKKNRPDDELINSAWHENTAYHKPFAPKDAVAFHEDERFDERFNDNTNNNINNEGNSTLAYMLRKGTKAAAIDESTAAAEVSSYNNNNNNNNNHHLHHHHHHPSSSTTSSLQDPAIVLGGASTNVITLYDRVWEYYDPHGRIQGPFTSIQMRQWANQNHFPPDLRLRYGPNLPWKPYSELFPASETNPPFTHFPIVTPTTRPPPPPPPPPPAPFGIMPQQKTASCASIMTTNLRSMLGLVQRSGASHDQPPPPPTTNHYHHHEGREMSPIKNKGKASTPPCPSMFPTLSDSVSGGVIGVVASSKNNVVLPSKLPDGKSKWKNNGATTSAGAVVSKSSLDESEFPEPSAAVFTKSTTKIKNNLAPASSTKPADLGKWSKKSLPEFFNETSTRPVKSAWFSEKLPLTSLNIAGPIEQFDQIPKSMPAVVATQPQPPSEEAAAAVIQKPSPPNVDVAEVVKLMKMCRVEFDVAMIEFLKHYETTEEVLDFLRDNLSLVGERAETFAEEFIALMKNPFTTVIYGRTSKISGGKASSGKKAKKRVVALDPSMLGFNEQNTRIMQGTIDYGE